MLVGAVALLGEVMERVTVNQVLPFINEWNQV